MNTELPSRATHPERKGKERAAISCILAGAIGDALGMPLERLPAAEIRRSYQLPIRGYQDPLPSSVCHGFGLKAGMYTDDTQAVRATAIGITRAGRLDARIVADALKSWLFEDSLGQSPRYPGVSTLAAMEKYRECGDPTKCGVPSHTCGAAIRIAPVALYLSFCDEPKFRERTVECARVTHVGVGAIDGAVIVAELVRSGIMGITPDISEILALCESKLVMRALRKVADALGLGTSAAELAEDLGIGGSTRACHVVPMALFHAYSADFAFCDTIKSGLDVLHPNGTDMDSILSIAGAISGVRDVEGVRRSGWLDDLEDADTLQQEAAALLRASVH